MKAFFASLLLLLSFSEAAQARVIGQWVVQFGQGILEYSIYLDGKDRSCITISDGSNETNGQVQIFLAISGVGPKPNSKVIFRIGSTSVEMYADSGGSISTKCHVCASDFDALWPLLRSGRSVRVTFNGKNADFPLRGAARTLPNEPPVADYYR